MENIDEYVDLVTDFCLNIGIRRQLDAFRGGYIYCRVSRNRSTIDHSPDKSVSDSLQCSGRSVTLSKPKPLSLWMYYYCVTCEIQKKEII